MESASPSYGSILDYMGQNMGMVPQLATIMSYLTDEQVSTLTVSKPLASAVQRVKETNQYWKERVENYYGVTLSDRVVDWQEVYQIITKGPKREVADIFSEAIDQDDVALVSILLEGYRQEESKLFVEILQEQLIKAVRLDRADIVAIMIGDSRVDPSTDNNYAIRLASRYGHVEVVKVLLQDPRVDTSADDNAAIRWASENRRVEVVKVLLQDPRVNPSAM